MTNPVIKFKRSAVPGKRPTQNQLPTGELALNTFDGQLFTQVNTGDTGIGSTVISLTPWKEMFGEGAIFYQHNVGIGSNNPTEKLTVDGNASITQDLIVGGSIIGSGASLTDIVKDITPGLGISISSNGDGSFTISSSLPETSSIYTEYDGKAEIRANTEIRGDLEVKDDTEIDGSLEVDGFADFHNDVRILGKLEILNEVEVDTIIGDGSGLSGVVTDIIGGNGITITDTDGVYTINATGIGTGTGGGTFISETDTLDTVTDRGSSTDNTINLGGLNVFGTSNFDGNTYFQGPVYAGVTGQGSFGENNQVLISTGNGVAWKTITGLTAELPSSDIADANFFREIKKFSATEGQRYIFTQYHPEYLDIFVNGVKLWDTEYIANDGSSILFTESLFADDRIEIHSHHPISDWVQSVENTDLTILRDTYTFLATSGLSLYNVHHRVGFIDIFVNGVRLNGTEFNSINGETIIFNEPLFGGEIVDIHVYNRFSSLISSSSKMIDNPPVTSSDVGIPGQTAYDSDYLYVCTSQNNWKRVTLEDW